MINCAVVNRLLNEHLPIPNTASQRVVAFTILRQHGVSKEQVANILKNNPEAAANANDWVNSSNVWKS